MLASCYPRPNATTQFNEDTGRKFGSADAVAIFAGLDSLEVALV